MLGRGPRADRHKWSDMGPLYYIINGPKKGVFGVIIQINGVITLYLSIYITGRSSRLVLSSLIYTAHT